MAKLNIASKIQAFSESQSDTWTEEQLLELNKLAEMKKEGVVKMAHIKKYFLENPKELETSFGDRKVTSVTRKVRQIAKSLS